MRAAFIERTGDAGSIRFGELPVPMPRDDEVLVRVAATAVDAVDTFIRSGAYPTALPMPFIIGRDLVGEVVAVGAAVGGWAAGAKVWTHSLGHAGRQGAAAEFAVVPADRLYSSPEGIDPVEMIAIVHAAATAHLALHVHGEVRAGETVFIGGGAGNVGRAAIEIAVDAGAHVVATASARDLQVCRDLGAEVAIDYRDDDLAARLRDAAPNGVDVHLDTSGHHDLDLGVGLLAPRGRLILMSGLQARPELPVGALYTRDAQIRGFAISTATVEELASSAALVNRLVAEGDLRDRRIELLPLSAAAEAHARVERGGLGGVKLVLVP